jgi:hypothetical protein
VAQRHVEKRYRESDRDNISSGGRFSKRPPYRWRPTPVMRREVRPKRLHMQRKPRLPMLPIR